MSIELKNTLVLKTNEVNCWKITKKIPPYARYVMIILMWTAQEHEIFQQHYNCELAPALIWREVHRSHVLSTRSYYICDQEVFDFLFYESLLFSS